MFFSPPTDVKAAQAAVAWTELVHLISLCARRLRASLAEHAAVHDLGELQFSLLWYCHRAPAAGISQSELVDAIEVSPAHVSNLVEQLRQKHLLAGGRSSVDRRRQVWRVTDQGAQLVEQIVLDLRRWAASLDRKLGSEQRQLLARLMEELSGAAQHAAVLQAERDPEPSSRVGRSLEAAREVA